MKKPANLLIISVLCSFALGGCHSNSSSDNASSTPAASTSPNILLIVLDDLGVDQLEIFGYGGILEPPAITASINAIAEQGVRFSNTWSMPTCTTTRATIFTGRYPFRTDVFNAITSTDLANSQVSPYAVTTPNLLRQKGYISALIGKMHLTGSELNPANNPLGLDDYRALGWDYFAGYLDGAPYSIDTTAGGVAAEGTYQCGFVPVTKVDPVNGADRGMCYFPDGSSQFMTIADTATPTPGRTCVEQGGLFKPNELSPNDTSRQQLAFDNTNGYYVGEWVINHADGTNEEVPIADPRARGWRVTLETDKAIDWVQQVQQQHPGKPWMMSVGYSAIHAPLQPPPAALLPNPLDPDVPLTQLDLLGCGTPVADQLSELGAGTNLLPNTAAFAQSRAVAQHMLEAMDHEIGRLLVSTGVATAAEDGSLTYNPESNTVVVIVGDNGTYAPSVKLPFDFNRAKGTPYQTGVWVPLIVAGPQVVDPGREEGAMVNTTDLYRLFAEIAGIDLSTGSAAGNKPLDAQPLMPYLTELAAPIRATNFTEVGLNYTSEAPPPCVITSLNMCVQIFPQQGVCEDQGGVWYGEDGDTSTPELSSCCAVNDYLVAQGGTAADIFPEDQSAVRNENYKLVRAKRTSCDTGNATTTGDYSTAGGYTTTDELYEINESTEPGQLKLDRAEDDLLAQGKPPLTSDQQSNYDELKNTLDELFASQITCPGDGNGDLLVNQTDVDEWEKWAYDSGIHSGLSSWYDLNHDGITDVKDKQIIVQNLGKVCQSS
jgi:arylsulfatase A-like enzyme